MSRHPFFDPDDNRPRRLVCDECDHEEAEATSRRNRGDACPARDDDGQACLGTLLEVIDELDDPRDPDRLADDGDLAGIPYSRRGSHR